MLYTSFHVLKMYKLINCLKIQIFWSVPDDKRKKYCDSRFFKLFHGSKNIVSNFKINQYFFLLILNKKIKTHKTLKFQIASAQKI